MASKKDKHLESAQRFMLKGQLDKAIKDYQQVVALEPKEVRYRQKLAELLVRDSRREEAIAQYEDIGKHYADNSYFLKAIAVYKQIQRLSPKNTDIALKLASLNHKQGLIGNALAEYGQVVAQFEKEGALKEAVKVLEQMLVIDGDHAATRLKYAELLYSTGAHDASYQAFSALLTSLRTRGDAAAAQQVYDRISRLFPGRVEEDLDAISARIASGQYDAAIAALRERAKHDSGNLRVWKLLCEASNAKGDVAASRHAYGQMMNLFPDEISVLEEGIRFHLDYGDPRGALSLIELHLPRFVEHEAIASVESLLSSLPGNVAKDPRAVDVLRRLKEAGASMVNSSNGQGAPSVLEQDPFSSQGLAIEMPPAFPPDAEISPPDDDAPSAFGSPWTPDSPLSSDERNGGGIQSDAPHPWEEEIELDLDDPETILAASADIDLPLDLSLSLDFEEMPAEEEFLSPPDDPSPYGDLASPFGELPDSPDPSPFAEAPSHDASPFEAAEFERSPFGEAPPSVETDLSFEEELPPFEELTSFEEPSSPFEETATPFEETASPFEETASPFGADDSAFSEAASLLAELASPSTEAASPSSEMASPFAEADSPLTEAPSSFDLEGSSLSLSTLSSAVETAPSDSSSPFSDPFASGEKGDFMEDGEGLIDLVLPDDSEEFPDIEWAEEEGLLEETEVSEEAGSLAAAATPTAKVRDWQEIFPDLGTDEGKIDQEELESHYDLGVGYKEMGMYNQAIKEFALAAANPQRRLDCLTLQAVCYREKGDPETAEDLLQRGRDLDVISSREKMMLSYELAFLLEIRGERGRAIELYREVHRDDPTFHDVAARLSALTGEEPLDIIDLDLEEG